MSGGRGSECGSGVGCFPVWHEALAEEQSDPTMAAWHNPLVRRMREFVGSTIDAWQLLDQPR